MTIAGTRNVPDHTLARIRRLFSTEKVVGSSIFRLVALRWLIETLRKVYAILSTSLLPEEKSLCAVGDVAECDEQLEAFAG
jgi:hypothetical protein